MGLLFFFNYSKTYLSVLTSVYRLSNKGEEELKDAFSCETSVSKALSSILSSSNSSLMYLSGPLSRNSMRMVRFNSSSKDTASLLLWLTSYRGYTIQR